MLNADWVRGVGTAVLVLMLLLILSVPAPALAETENDAVYFLGEASEDVTPEAKGAILYETTTDTVVYEKNGDRQLPPASMTKIMTAILVLEENPQLEGELTVDERAVSSYYCSSMDPTNHLLAGEVISYEDCMNYMLIPSANEAATAFAFAMADDMKDFAQQMTEKAKEIGCKNTEFWDPTGISPNDLTTPEDMVKIAKYAMTFDKFREIVCRTEGTVPPSNMRETGFDYENSNALLTLEAPDNPYAGQITGVKTGWTPQAGYCLTCAMEKEDQVWLSVVMGIEDSMMASDGSWIRGDAPVTISLLNLTEELTEEDLTRSDRYLQIAGIVATAFFAVVIAVIYYNKRHRREM